MKKKEELDTDFTSQGTVVTTKTSEGNELPIYHVEPKEGTPTAGIVVLPDIYSVRVFDKECSSGDRIGFLCDALAERGYSVALARVFRKEPYDIAVLKNMTDYTAIDVFAPPGSVEWFKKFNYAKVGPDIVAATNFLREKLGNEAPMGILGFCFGTWAMSKASASGDVAFTYGIGCHPATLLEQGVHGGDEMELIKSVKMPMTMLAASNDSEVYNQGKPGRQALEALGGSVIDFPDMVHGWVSRGDTTDESVKRDVDKALKDIFAVFDEKLKKQQ